MPVDTSSYGLSGPQASPADSFLRAMQGVQQMHAQRDESALRRQQLQNEQFKLQEAQQAAAEDDQFKQAIRQGANLPFEQFRQLIADKAPGHLAGIDKSKADLDEKAALAKKATAEMQSAQAQAAKHQQDYLGIAYDHIVQSGGDPHVISQELNLATDHFPDAAPRINQLRELAATQGKDAFLATLKSMVPPAMEKTRAEGTKAVADAAQAQRVLAGTSPTGITAEQGVQNANAAANARTSAGQLAVAQAREKREQLSDPFSNAAAQGSPAAISALPAGLQSQVKALVEGRMAFPTGRVMSSPYWQKMLGLVAAADPSFDAVNFNARAATRRDFTSGGSAKSVNAIQTVIGHLSDLSDKAEALHNGSIPALNSVKNWLSSAGGNAAVPSFETIKKGVTDELTRVWRQAGGSEGDIKTWASNLNSSQSPDQFKGVLATVGDMLESKLGALDTQYQQGMGTDKVSTISPESRRHLDKLKGNAPAAAPSVTASAAGAADGTERAIPGVPGGVAKLTNGKWIRIK